VLRGQIDDCTRDDCSSCIEINLYVTGKDMKGLLEKTPDPLGEAGIDEILEIKRLTAWRTCINGPKVRCARPVHPIPSICIRDNLR
jgi:hypothetical protein